MVYKRFLLLCLIVITGSAESFNRSLFFRTSAFWDEPRFERPWLFTGELQLMGGSNSCGRNTCSKVTNILDIYGPENVAALSNALGIPLNLPGNPKEIFLHGVADVFEADLNLYQNFCRGFFLHFHFPAILVHLYPSGYRETMCTLKKCKSCRSKRYKPLWQTAQETLRNFLEQADLAIDPRREGGASDSTLFLGWTHSFENTQWLDFVDVTFKSGVLFPTGKKRDLLQVFDIPFGYGGFWAIPLSADISWGAYDWLTVGLHADALLFFKKKHRISLKGPLEAPTGFITLGRGEAEVRPGAVWRTGAYIKADHFYNGLSLLLAGAYEQQNRYRIKPCDSGFSESIVNQDQRYKSWSRALIQLLIEYDFATETSWYSPRVALFYNRELTGRRVFTIHTLGSYAGIDVSWCF